MFAVARFFFPLAWLLLCTSCSALLQTGASLKNALSIDNTDDRYTWADSSEVKGNDESLTLEGNCSSKTSSVILYVGNDKIGSAACSSGSYTFADLDLSSYLSAGDGTYKLKLVPVGKNGKSGGGLERNYNYKRADLSSSVTVDAVPGTVSATTYSLSGVCDATAQLTLQVGNLASFSCPASGVWSNQTVDLTVVGVNSIAVAWNDAWGNTAATVVPITRADSLDPSQGPLVAGYAVSCRIASDDTLRCWGINGTGVLGQDNTTQLGDDPGEMAALSAIDFGGHTVKAVSLGTVAGHSCAILDDDTLRCWGNNGAGQLGYDDNNNRGDDPGEMAALTAVNLGQGVKSVRVGSSHTCAILLDGSVKCWGLNVFGQLGYDDTNHRGNDPGEMAALGAIDLGGHSAKMLAAGQNHTCALLDDNSVRCWGYNGSGQLGYDDTANRGDNGGEMAVLSTVNLGQAAKFIAAGNEHSCAILADDTLKCWGRNFMGQLGQDNGNHQGDGVGEMAALAPINLGGHTAKSVGGGNDFTCAVLDDDSLKCWGVNSRGQLGLDSTRQWGHQAGDMATLPKVDLGARTVKNLSVGYSHVCVLLDNDKRKCWGEGGAGLGYEDNKNRGGAPIGMSDIPAINFPGRTVLQSAVGYTHTCALLDDFTVRCWGANNFGQLGLGDSTDRGGNPGDMAALTALDFGGPTAKAITAGAEHTCAILSDDSARCWGYNDRGQLGYDHGGIIGNAPGQLAAQPSIDFGGATVKAINAGDYHTCAILNDDTVRCWGENQYGQLGYEDTDDRGNGVTGTMPTLPAVNLGAHTAKAISAGVDHTCAILDDDSVKCWGRGDSGQLGLESSTSYGAAAGDMALLGTVMLGANTAKAVEAAGNYTCAILNDDSVKCWGYGASGALGNGSLFNVGQNPGDMTGLAPVNLGPGRTAKAVRGSYGHTCAVLDNDTVRCWGESQVGELGNDNSLSYHDAATAPLLDLGAGRTAKNIFMHDFTTCVLRDNDTLKCFGHNNRGQLGYDDLLRRGNSLPLSDATEEDP